MSTTFAGAFLGAAAAAAAGGGDGEVTVCCLGRFPGGYLDDWAGYCFIRTVSLFVYHLLFFFTSRFRESGIDFLYSSEGRLEPGRWANGNLLPVEGLGVGLVVGLVADNASGLWDAGGGGGGGGSLDRANGFWCDVDDNVDGNADDEENACDWGETCSSLWTSLGAESLRRSMVAENKRRN